MKIIKYFLQFIIIIFFFIIFKILGYKKSSDLGAYIFSKLGHFFRSKKVLNQNLRNINLNDGKTDYENFINKIWANYGRIFADYTSIIDFRKNNLEKFITVEGVDILKKIKTENKPVVFISGHFNNFELMAMIIEKNGINLSAIYRPLNNIFLNKLMERIRENYICKNQIKKGVSGSRDLLKAFKNGSSIAIMIDQRVSEGNKIPFFNKMALTTTIPAQLVKRFNCKIIPVHIERYNNYHFKASFSKPFEFADINNLNEITLQLNSWLEKKIIKNPTQWIWTHNRWKL